MICVLNVKFVISVLKTNHHREFGEKFMQIRTKALRKALNKSDLSGYIITHVNNIYYFTGFLDIPDAKLCLIVPLKGEPILFTNPLSYSAAFEKARGCVVKLVKSSEKIFEKVADEIRTLKLTRVGFDDMNISFYLKLIKKLGNVDFQQKTELVWKLRKVKSDEEIQWMKKAAEFADAGMKAGLEALKAGVHEYEVAAEAEYEMRARGSEGTAFETIVASGPRSAYPHVLCSDRIIQYRDKFLHGLGHGVGLNIHEPPTLSKSSKDILEEGNVVTVEPGVYIQGFGGGRIEDTVLVLRGAGEKLTKIPCTMMI